MTAVALATLAVVVIIDQLSKWLAVTTLPPREAVPVLDPKLGWIIPVTPATAKELAELPKGPGEHELSALHLGLIVE